MTDVIVRMKTEFVLGSDTRSAITTSPGGSAMNTAAWLAESGGSVHFIACVGDDEAGNAAHRSMQQIGVKTYLQKSGSRLTGTVVSVVGPGGERSMLADRGANLDLGEAELPIELFTTGTHLHLSGYVLLDESTLPTGLAAIELAKKRQMTISIDPCSAGPVADVGASTFLGWIAGVDLWCGNLDEGRALTGADEPKEVIALLARGFPEVVLTTGADGVLYQGRGGQVIAVSARKVEVIDTTGAGDAFTGTFLASWLAGSDPTTALQHAVEVAAQVVAVAGARSLR